VQRSVLENVKILLYHEIRNELSFNLRYLSTSYNFGKYGLGGWQSFRATLYIVPHDPAAPNLVTWYMVPADPYTLEKSLFRLGLGYVMLVCLVLVLSYAY